MAKGSLGGLTQAHVYTPRTPVSMVNDDFATIYTALGTAATDLEAAHVITPESFVLTNGATKGNVSGRSIMSLPNSSTPAGGAAFAIPAGWRGVPLRIAVFHRVSLGSGNVRLTCTPSPLVAGTAIGSGGTAYSATVAVSATMAEWVVTTAWTPGATVRAGLLHLQRDSAHAGDTTTAVVDIVGVVIERA